MIHFKESFVNQVKLMRTLEEFTDEFNDLSKIESLINKQLLTQEDMEEAKRLDKELYQKYPETMYLLKVVNNIRKVSSLSDKKFVHQIPEIENLIQDKFGIYAHILIKSNNIKNIKDFIDYVD